MNDFFEKASCEDLGLPAQCLKNFLARLEAEDLSMHSGIIMRHDKICMEAYYAPYERDTLHRMFSITKSFVSLAIGLLADEGKLSLDDHICDYFPEYEPEDGFYPYMRMLKIRDMLAMKTCHNQTTYKAAGKDDWTSTFFTTKPSHVPGTNFSYDTSSTHTLGALVEKLTGMELLDYLRVKFLDEIGFSKDAFILKDPVGVSMGGSGLCARPIDILKIIWLISKDGVYNGKQLLPHDFVVAARQKHADPYGKSAVIEEMQGYGYQIWLTRNGGYVLYGMAGQLALYVPEKDIFMMTTADGMGRQGAVQAIYNSFWEEIYNKISDEPVTSAITQDELNSFIFSRKLFTMEGEFTSPVASNIDGVSYIMDENKCGLKSIQVDLTEDGGCVNYTNATGAHSVEFGFGSNKFGSFPDYNLKYAASASFKMEDYLLIKIQIIDTAIGNMYMGLNFKDDYITVMFRKMEEYLFTEYDGVMSGRKIQ